MAADARHPPRIQHPRRRPEPLLGTIDRGAARLPVPLVADSGDIVARARSIPLRSDGSVNHLPVGIDGAIARGLDEAGANVLCAPVIMVPRDIQGRGVSAAAVRAMREVAHRRGLDSLIAPVRPSGKDRYPLTPIERYARRRRSDGVLFDPWMRVHERVGADLLKPEPRSLRITGSVAEWEQWTGMSFPESGEYCGVHWRNSDPRT